jgi:hypothetical protein
MPGFGGGSWGYVIEWNVVLLVQAAAAGSQPAPALLGKFGSEPET